MNTQRNIIAFVFWITASHAFAQPIQKLQNAMNRFTADTQVKYASTALYVINAATGKSVYNLNAFTGMATASTAKIVTAAAALDILGADYRFETRFGIITNDKGTHLYIQPSGDPTLGSWRWEQTRDSAILSALKKAIATCGVKQFASIIINTARWGTETIPDGWIWQDLGNYYGAAAQPVNWRENQFDLVLQSGATEGSAVKVVHTLPVLYDYTIVSNAMAGPKNSGDNSYLYYPSMGSSYGVLQGSIPAGQSRFVVSGSVYNPANQLVKTIIAYLKNTVTFTSSQVYEVKENKAAVTWMYTHQSPELSKIIYWFLRKSINLYGEALLKTMALQKGKEASTDNGVAVVKNHWTAANIAIQADEIHAYDGSGLSPQNRITTHAQTQILQYAQGRPWFKDYYEAFPLYNNMKMKSGTINRVKGFSGYQLSKDGTTYIFSFLINNYSGSEYALVKKMYAVLDALK